MKAGSLIKSLFNTVFYRIFPLELFLLVLQNKRKNKKNYLLFRDYFINPQENKVNQ